MALYAYPASISRSTYPLIGNPSKHYYPSRRGSILGIVVHVTAGLQDLDGVSDQSAEGTNRYGATTARAASWHVCVDSDSIAPALPASYTAFHVRDFNSRTFGLEISNKDARWDNKPAAWTTATLRNAARAVAPIVKANGLPLIRQTSKATVAGKISSGQKFGFVAHSVLNPDTRIDPGATFSWPRFLDMVKAELGATTTPTTSTATSSKPAKLTVDGNFGPATARVLQQYIARVYRSRIVVDGQWGSASAGYLEGVLNYEAGKRGWAQLTVTRTTKPGARSTFTSRLRWLIGHTPVDGPWDTATTRRIQTWLNAKNGY